MSVEFKWEGDEPKNPPASEVIDAFEYDLTHLPDDRGLCRLIASAKLWQDAIRSKVEGVGYSKDGEPIVIFHYSLHDPRFHWWDYYENPVRPKP